ncbi:glycoside hydrolase family 13 protein [Suhomyces tanzawaensis NRRL Y-17324]|uniref:Glycoside hydrolase family 13 protein n=1 Tax=Suhomyces tanzawaensis NRRL Y-17324 TaxID=984487 RepID=A0A1E4SIX1_9ASCO|nr:glycoside hydrolase family 13 protein [Suhomyces tanzawaensis NRRL Y-17324]ODV79440.1 glycoside hydrolase family 13 protein [Suhomyces tanzawaensis NRRL Y-17324]
MTISYTWWKDATVYQIWPASFKDSNGDGLGDIPGIISKLDYLKNLGVDVIWMSPMYDSPQDDMGYDISDYKKVYPKYGTVDDMKVLLDEAHSRGIKLVLDLVVNHTSSEHRWFKESRSSLDNDKRDWYVWKKPKYDAEGNRHPPNNWSTHFSEPAWTYDETTDEYYLHLFAKSQPDLNWENPATRNAIYDEAMSFWFELGVDGFRIDVANMYSKDQRFLDVPIVFPDQSFQPCMQYTHNGPRIHEFHKEMFEKVTSKYDAMTVGEVAFCSREDALKYVSAKEKEMSMIFLFDVVDVGTVHANRLEKPANPWKLSELKQAVENQCEFIKGTDAWSTVFFENHDQPRSISKFGSLNPKYNFKSAKLLAMLQTALTGTLYIYQGQEIAMANLPASWSIDEYLDIMTINYYRNWVEIHGKDADFEEQKKVILEGINMLARDHARSPVQWDASEYAGFSPVAPWTRVNDNYKEINVESQLNDPNSVLHFWAKSLKVRKEHKDLLIYGAYKTLDQDNEQVYSFIKYQNDETSSPKAFVTLNFSDEPAKFERLVEGQYTLVNSNVDVQDEATLSPYEGRLYIVD